MNSQLLCTFCKPIEVINLCDIINKKYVVISKKVFVLQNVKDITQHIVSYNVTFESMKEILPSTISVHRKKQTNTIYTINALNQLIMEKNNGILDKNYRVDWNELQNMLLVTAYGKLKKIETKVIDIINLGE